VKTQIIQLSEKKDLKTQKGLKLNEKQSYENQNGGETETPIIKWSENKNVSKQNEAETQNFKHTAKTNHLKVKWTAK
jgi:hypothetical protein